MVSDHGDDSDEMQYSIDIPSGERNFAEPKNFFIKAKGSRPASSLIVWTSAIERWEAAIGGVNCVKIGVR